MYPTRGFSLAVALVALVAPAPSRPFAIVIIDDVPNALRARDDGRSPLARVVVVVRARAAASAPIAFADRESAHRGASRASERSSARSSTLGVIVDAARVAARALVDARDAARRIIDIGIGVVDGARDTPRR